MDNKSDISFQLVDDMVRLLAEKLQIILKDSRLPGKVSHAAQKTSQGVFGYVSFSPHQNPEEENVDATILVNLLGVNPKISADICWSDGEIIEDFGEYEISRSSLDSLSQEIQFVFTQFEEKVFEKMVILITSNLQTKYRNN
jgi:hypothetical protein